ncbi:hypothetical protein IPC1308_18395 [Pseudomonas aeruginosa]|nr:hypothetical protein IPC1308_18395 [Pseudomonas aeruginosa]TEI36542.1 hypothetical protein IPC1309_04555 [Pseudomonas aeruginosa]
MTLAVVFHYCASPLAPTTNWPADGHWEQISQRLALQGDAADSPIVQDKNQNSYAVFLMYRF